VDETAEEIPAVHASQRRRVTSSRGDGGSRLWRPKVERAVWPPAVVVAHVDAEHALELAATNDQESVEALATDAADPALDVRVRVRRPDWRPDDPDVFACEDGIERRGELVSRSWTRKCACRPRP
jgi:hypothetical protein